MFFFLQFSRAKETAAVSYLGPQLSTRKRFSAMLNDRFFPIIDLSFELHNFELVNPRRLPKQSQQGAFLVIFFSETYVRQMKKYHMGHRM